LQEVLNDVHQLNQRIQAGEALLLSKIEACQLTEQLDLMCTVPGVSKMLALRIIAEMGANYHQRYYSAEAFAKGIGVVPSNEVSAGKLLKRRASHGNKRAKFHLLQSAKSWAIHGRGPLHDWYKMYRSRTTYMKAISALARRIAEARWWVLVRNEPYRYWSGEHAQTASEVAELGDLLVSPTTGEVLQTLASTLSMDESLSC
jgi:Transposase IS116/IS110/IS902 family